ncbi:MAG: glucosidase [Cytophagales bacterium]
MTIEQIRLNACVDNTGWKKWGPYLTERQWGTVREDYSPDGSAWEFTTHDMARSKAYRWGEEGIMGISDNKQVLCFAPAFWNGKDPILKERLFGVTGNQGNHGEDVKELYYYLDSTPTHSYMKALYKYPIDEYPYSILVKENQYRSKELGEFEIYDYIPFHENKYFEIFCEYAKVDENDILIKITVENKYSEAANIEVLPTFWFRNYWQADPNRKIPKLELLNSNVVGVRNEELDNLYIYFDSPKNVLFCNNETNYERLYQVKNSNPYPKDGINDYIIYGKKDKLNPNKFGTKTAAQYSIHLEPGQKAEVRVRMSHQLTNQPFENFESIFLKRISEANEFYNSIQNGIKDADLLNIQRQAYAGMLWSKQFYYFNIKQWLKGDPKQPTPPEQRLKGRNNNWKHFNVANIISMPDKWEYPWFAAWDLAFHTIPLCRVDPIFAKRQLEILLREYYMHPNGQIPAYEWNFNDVNPPVHAWATWKVYEIDKKLNNGKGDIAFLEKIFHKLLLNFTWWVNRKDSEGNNIFEGGFLGLDNIGVFDRSQPLPTGGFLEQADGTSWMAMFSLNMLKMSVEISLVDPVYQDMASKFLEHFLFIAGSLNEMGQGQSLWDDEDKFYYDLLHMNNGYSFPLKIRSMVGIIPLFAIETIDQETLDKLPVFKKRVGWILQNKADLAELISRWHEKGKDNARILSLSRWFRTTSVLQKVLDENEFLSEYGIRALSKFHEKQPYEFDYNGKVYSVEYAPGESKSSLFGGNSNWRGPIWFPVNYMLIESLLKAYNYYGDVFIIEYPTGSGQMKNLKQIADMIGERLIHIFKYKNGKRAVNGEVDFLNSNPDFKDLILFYEYFHGDNGKGLGASHQTGWTGLIADLIHTCNEID